MDQTEKVARNIASYLKKAIKARGFSTLIVSGGRSPQQIFSHINRLDIGWHNIIVSLVDDRLLPSDHNDSNEKNIKTNLLKNFATKATFVSMCNETQKLRDLPRPFDVMLLGVGEDGHFASLFPNMVSSEEALKNDAPPKIIETPKNGSPLCYRLSMNLTMILETRRCILIGHTKEKMWVINRAMGDQSLPLHYLLNNKTINVEIIKE